MFYKKDIDDYIEIAKINEREGKAGLLLGIIAIVIALAIILPLSFYYGVDISRIIESCMFYFFLKINSFSFLYRRFSYLISLF